MATTTSLSLRSVLVDAVDALGLAGPAPAITGVGGSARALVVAAHAHRLRTQPLLYVVASDAALDDVVDDVRFMLQGLEGLADGMVERVVLPFPSLQVDPYRGLAPHFRAVSARAYALHALASSQARVVVASAAALLPRLAAPDEVRALTTVVQPGQDIDPERLVSILADGGFARQDPVDEHGEFCLRGGILDVFAAGDDMPVRIEFVGDTVESIRRFDPATQRSTDTLDRFTVVPVRDFSASITDDAPRPQASIADYLGGAHVIVAEPSDVREQVTRASTHVAESFEARAASDARGLATANTVPRP